MRRCVNTFIERFLVRIYDSKITKIQQSFSNCVVSKCSSDFSTLGRYYLAYIGLEIRRRDLGVSNALGKRLHKNAVYSIIFLNFDADYDCSR